MKTTQIVERDLNGFTVRQNHKTGYLNANDLLAIGNEYRKKLGLPQRYLDKYFQTDATKEFLEAVSREEGIPVKELKKTKTGRYGGTYVHPLVFVDIAMWVNPDFKVKVFKWLTDKLLLYRDNSGDSFKKAMAALDKRFNLKSLDYPAVANRVAAACGVPYRPGKNRWNLATEQQLKLRDKIHEYIAVYADVCSDPVETVNAAINKALEVEGLADVNQIL